jgi:hypothetical protein
MVARMPKNIDLAALDTDGLKNLIANYRAHGATESPTYVAALSELERRIGGGLDFDKSYRVIRDAAKNRRFVSYKELADASGVEWSRVHYAMGEHLWRLVEYAHRTGWPMLSAIVVNKQNIGTGRMEPESLKGFIGAAKELGYTIADQIGFLREQQELVFRWGASL